LDKAPDCQSGDHGFESRMSRQFMKSNIKLYYDLCSLGNRIFVLAQLSEKGCTEKEFDNAKHEIFIKKEQLKMKYGVYI
jgi:hypothetical protein